MKTTFTLSITFSLYDGKEIFYEGQWTGERGPNLPKDWVELRVSPIEMINAETPANLAQLLIDNLGHGPYYEHKPILDEKTRIIEEIKALRSMDDISSITVHGITDDGNGRSYDELFSYDSEARIMTGMSRGETFAYGDAYGNLDFHESTALKSPRYALEDGTQKGIFYNETDEEKLERLWAEFNAKMESFEKEYGSAKDAYLANLERFPSYPDVESANQIIDFNAKIVFPDKYIVVYGCPESLTLAKEIEKRGAFYRGGALKKADFFVLWDPDDPDGRHESTIEKMLDFRERGGEAVFITAYQLWEALKTDSSSAMNDDELEMLNLEREEQRILSEMERIREKIAEEKRKKK